MGIRAALRLLDQEGIANVFARHRRLAGAVQAASNAGAKAVCSISIARSSAAISVSVAAVGVREGYDPEAIRRTARERFQVAVAGGLGMLTGRVFRIGHLGDLNDAMILGCLGGVQAALEANSVAGRGALERATSSLLAA